MDLSQENIALKEKVSFLFDVLKRYDHYIATTNFKIGLLLSFIGVVVLGLAIRMIAIGPVQGDCGYMRYAVLISASITMLLSLASAISLLRAVFPNTETYDDYRSLIFFGDVARSENGAVGYMREMKEATLELLIEDLSKQTFVVAGIVNEKFRILKLAVRLLAFGVIPFLFVTILLFTLKGWS
jgi:hypothetical protein